MANITIEELKRLNGNINEFLAQSLKDDMDKKAEQEKPCCAKNKCKSKKQEKELLQEKTNG